MREIKFRGKRIDTCEWVYGYLIENCYIVGKVVDWEEDYFNTEFWYKVDPDTVGQYTGLKDKNGKEIYEGDIVKEATTHKFIVSCENGHTYISYKCSRTKYKDLLFDFYIKDDELEIIGNRWDNPELMEV